MDKVEEGDKVKTETGTTTEDHWDETKSHRWYNPKCEMMTVVSNIKPSIDLLEGSQT